MAEVVNFKAHEGTYMFTGSFYGLALFKKSRVLLCSAVLYSKVVMLCVLFKQSTLIF